VRERNEMTAQLFLRGLAGELTPTGQTVLDIKDLDTDPVDMSPLICGKKAKAYVKQRMADFPYGLKGKPSFLSDKIAGPTYIATELSKVVDIPMPRPRPDNGVAAVASN
jgi:D-alanyl-D-alanine carboxypeptidase